MSPKVLKKKQATAVKFADEQEHVRFKECLIGFVRNHRLLWDHDNEDYQNNAKKKSTWLAFCETHYSYLSVDSVKKSWKSLRDAFRREHVKLTRNGYHGQCDGEVEKWTFYDSMLFLRDAIDDVDEEVRAPDKNDHNNPTNFQNQAPFSSNQRHATASSAITSEPDLDQFLSFDYNDVIVDNQGNQGNLALESVETQHSGTSGTASHSTGRSHKSRKRKVGFNAESKFTSINATVPADALLKLDQLNQNINNLVKQNNLSREPNYSFVISLLEMMKCIKNEHDLADLKAKIYKLIADTIATQQSS